MAGFPARAGCQETSGAASTPSPAPACPCAVRGPSAAVPALPLWLLPPLRALREVAGGQRSSCGQMLLLSSCAEVCKQNHSEKEGNQGEMVGRSRGAAGWTPTHLLLPPPPGQSSQGPSSTFLNRILGQKRERPPRPFRGILESRSSHCTQTPPGLSLPDWQSVVKASLSEGLPLQASGQVRGVTCPALPRAPHPFPGP